MSTKTKARRKKIIEEIDKLPDKFLEEIHSYLEYLKFREKLDAVETHIASESSLAKDWLKPEEDKAWKNL